MKRSLYVGLDIGTTAIKLLCLANDGTIVYSDSLPHDLLTSNEGFAEEDTSVWEQHTYALFTSLIAALPAAELMSIKAIGVTGMVPTLIPLDAEFHPIDFSIQQQDNRAAAEIETMQRDFDADWVFEKTGNMINSQHSGPKLIWMKKHKPDLFSRMSYILGSYDYIRYILCGTPAIERNWALESGMWDIREQRWLDEVLSYCAINTSYFPNVVRPQDIVGYTTSEFAAKTGFPAGVAVVGGCADHIASAFSTGARSDGDLVLKLGGAGDVLFCIDQLVTDKRLFIDYQCDGSDRYVLNGCTATSGSLLKWFKQEASLPDFEEMDVQVQQVEPTSDGVVVLPYFLGEKTPLFDTYAKGVIYGLSLSHTRVHIYRAILEAVAYSFRHHIEVFEERGLAVKRVYITNGGSKSTLWRSILADVIGHDVLYIPKHPGSCLGGAIIAGMAVGDLDQSIIDTLLSRAVHIPYDWEHHERYNKGYKMYRQLYEQLKEMMRAA